MFTGVKIREFNPIGRGIWTFWAGLSILSNLSIGQIGANGSASAVGIVINLAILWLMFGQKGKAVFSEY